MSLLRLKTTECRLGIVGLYNSGKTVLLTSLINHLQDHDPSRFALGGSGVSVRKFEQVPADTGWDEFNYAGSRDALVFQGKWPAKTRDRSMFCCRFERSDWTFSDVLLKLYDLPGERIADTAMLGKDFAQWSDHLLGLLRNDSHYRRHCEPFLNAINDAAADEATILSTYRLALANLILAFKPMISPSTFLLDRNGQLASRGSAEELAANRLAGLDAQSQFAPLPSGLRSASSELMQRFAERYTQYQESIVAPHIAALRSCHALLVLVDVTMVLAGGVGMYDDTRQILRDLLDVLKPGETPVDAMLRKLGYMLLPYQLRSGGITRVAFVAPKLDLVHPLDRDKMVYLLKRMVEKYANDRDGLTTAYMNCSAVVSTQVLPDSRGKRELVGRPLRDAEGKKIPPGTEQRFTTSELPDDWPMEWHAGTFSFPEVYPRVPTRKDYPPDQINLDRLLTFLLV